MVVHSSHHCPQKTKTGGWRGFKVSLVQTGYHVLALCSEHLQNTPSLLRTVQARARLQCKIVIGPEIREQKTAKNKMGTDSDI